MCLYYLGHVLHKTEHIVGVVDDLYFDIACFTVSGVHIYVLVAFYLVLVEAVK